MAHLLGKCHKAPTSYRLSIDTIALNCIVFEKIAFFAFWRQTDKQTNKWTAPMHYGALAIASGGLKITQKENVVKRTDSRSVNFVVFITRQHTDTRH